VPEPGTAPQPTGFLDDPRRCRRRPGGADGVPWSEAFSLHLR
jgi:hypothetical protein